MTSGPARYRHPANPGRHHLGGEQNWLSVTHIYHRENGLWRIAHRHGDVAPAD